MSGLKGEAKKQFKNLLGYCGDRKYQYPDPLIRDIAAKGKLSYGSSTFDKYSFLDVIKEGLSAGVESLSHFCVSFLVLYGWYVFEGHIFCYL